MLIRLTSQYRPDSAPAVVLDTNVVLDWLLFRNAAGLAVGEQVSTGRWRWLATAAMREELTHVLSRGGLDRWAPDLRAVHRNWGSHCTEVNAPSLAVRFRCTDPDDQKFIDLAVATRTPHLLTRDRAVLKLARRLRHVGVDVLTPNAWAAIRPAG